MLFIAPQFKATPWGQNYDGDSAGGACTTRSAWYNTRVLKGHEKKLVETIILCKAKETETCDDRR